MKRTNCTWKHTLAGGALLLMASLTGCTSSKVETTGGGIDVAGAFENLTELKVSQLGKNIRFIPLETTDSVLVGGGATVRIYKNDLYISSGGRGSVATCQLFDKQTGKFIRQIGRKGSGPKDFDVSQCYIHPETGELYFKKYPNKLLKYNREGQFLGEVIVTALMNQFNTFLFCDSLLLNHFGESLDAMGSNSLVYMNERGEAKDSLPQFTRTGKAQGMGEIAGLTVFSLGKFNVVDGSGLIYVNFKDDHVAALPALPTLWTSAGEIRYKEMFNDSIYSIKGVEAVPSIVFNTGKYHFPAEKRNDKDGSESTLVILSVHETPDRLLFTAIKGIYTRDKTVYNGIYDKTTGITTMNKSTEGLTDDLAGFMPFYPATCSAEGEYATLIEAHKVVEWLEEHPEIAKEGKLEFLKNLKEDDNPVCVIVEP